MYFVDSCEVVHKDRSNTFEFCPVLNAVRSVVVFISYVPVRRRLRRFVND